MIRSLILSEKQVIFDYSNLSPKLEKRDSDLIDLIKQGSEAAFEKVFRQYFKGLHAYAYTFMKDDEQAEEIVQNVFFRVWEKRGGLKTDGSVKAYLYRAVHNESLNYLKHQKTRAAFQVHYNEAAEPLAGNASEKVLTAELGQHIQKALDELPQQCRTIFQMSRFEHLKYQQIADQLNLSIKTVENQMGKALKILRLKLAEFLPLVLFFLTGLFKK